MAYFSGEFWAELIRPRKFLILLFKSFRLSAGQSVKPPIDVKWDASSWALVINTFECQLLWSGGFRKLKWLVWSLVWLTRKLKHDGSAPGNSKYLVLTPMSFWFYYMASLLRRGPFVSQGCWVKEKGSARGTPRANLVPMFSLLPALSLHKDG